MSLKDLPEREQDPIESALAEFHDAWFSGRPPDVDAFCRSHPECGPELRKEIEHFLYIAGGLPGLEGPGDEAGEEEPVLEEMGDFRILKRIGRGGMGVVYEAEQISLRRPVALKVLPSHLSLSDDSVLKFRREAEAGGRQSHPGIVIVYAVGEHEGTHYIAQELVEGGRTLADRLSELKKLGNPPQGYFRWAAKLAAELSDALDHAHTSGVTHRDVKPSNILLTSNEYPKITDFGLAKVEDALALSRSGEFAGTPYYMSPEQAGGRQSRIDSRTDIYSLGVTLYEMLTLARPFDGETSLEVLKKILQSEPRAPRRLNPRVPRDLEVICLKAMEKNPEARYKSMAEFGADLHRYISGEVIKARPAGLGMQAVKWMRRHRGISAAALGLLLISVILIAGSLYREKEKSRTFDLLFSRADGAAASGRWDEAIELIVKALGFRPDDLSARERHKEYLHQKELIAVREERDEKEKAFQYSEGLRLAAQSSLVLDKNPTLALLLAMESAKHNPGRIANNAMLEALCRSRELKTLIHKRYPFHPGFMTVDRGGVLTASFNPDGKKALTAMGDNRVRLWDVESGEMIRILDHGTKPIPRAIFGPHGKRIATTSYDGDVHLWDAENGEQILKLTGHGYTVIDLNFSFDGQKLVTAAWDRTARVWDLETGEALLVIKGHEGPLYSAVFSSDGGRVLTSSTDGTARIWESMTGKEFLVLKGHEKGLRHASFSADGQRVVTVSLDHSARVWDAVTGEENFVFQGPGSLFFEMPPAYFSPDGQWIVMASGGKYAGIWNALTGEGPRLLGEHGAEVRTARFSPDGSRVVTASFDQTARIFDTLSGREVMRFEGHEDLLLGAAFSPDGRKVITVSEDGTARIWDASIEPMQEQPSQCIQLDLRFSEEDSYTPDHKTAVADAWGKTARIVNAMTDETEVVLRGHEGNVLGVCFSPDGRRVVTGSEDRTARIWDRSTGETRVVLKGHEEQVFGARFSPDGSRVVTGSHDCTARVWDAVTGEEYMVLSHPKHGLTKVRGACFTPDGRRIITALENGMVGIWDHGTGDMLMQLKGHTRWVMTIGFSPCGQWLVTTSFDQTARIWDRKSGEERTVLRGHEGPVLTAVFSLDSNLVATGSEDGTACIWDRASGERLLTVKGLDKVLARGIRFSRDGAKVIAWTGGKTARSWPLDVPGAAARRKPRELTIAEKSEYSIWEPGEREALDLVGALYAEHLISPDVMGQIEGREELSKSVREAAVRFAHLQEDNAGMLVMNYLGVKTDAPSLFLDPAGGKEACEQALPFLEAAFRLEPERGIWSGMLGACSYRLGKYEDAARKLEKARAMLTVEEDQAHLYVSIFLAMAHHRLGREVDAQAVMGECRIRMKEAEDKKYLWLPKFYGEALELIGP